MKQNSVWRLNWMDLFEKLPKSILRSSSCKPDFFYPQ